MKRAFILVMAIILTIAALPAFSQSANISVNAASTGASIGSTHYGIFFEELNHAGDGGLWAELIKNRSFEDGWSSTDGWTMLTTGGAAGNMAADKNNPLNTYNVTEMAVNVTAIGTGRCGIYNSGYWSLPITSGKTYNCVVYARKASGFTGNLNIVLEDSGSAASNVYTITNASLSTTWTKYTFALTATRTVAAGRLSITTQSTGTFYLTYVSVMPGDADDGFRPDLLKMLKDLHPGFVRCPGGSYVNGNTLDNAWKWKAGIGPYEARRTHFTWGYFTTNSIGLYELLLLCEKLGAEPLIVVNCGMSQTDTVTGAALAPYVQDALDAIEFANGDSSTTWGAQRAAMGHPAPFSLKYIEIGNENSGSVYSANYPAFYSAIKAAYPSMTIIANSPVPGQPVEILDEHFFPPSDWFIQNNHYYDAYSRTGPKIYVGEQSSMEGDRLGNHAGALGEAMWRLGMERNADVVTMASFAPLFTHVNNRAWSPDLINFDATSCYGIPSYHMQKMFGDNKGDITLATTFTGPTKSKAILSGGVGLSTWNTSSEFGEVLVTSGSNTLYQSNFAGGTTGWTPDKGTWTVANGNLQQTDATVTDNCRDYYYAPSWSDYTLTLKARKISGSEGFMVMFRAQDHDNFYQWIVGGWGNTRTLVTRTNPSGRTELSPATSDSIQTNVWYYIKIVVQGNHIQCYLKQEGDANYRLVHDVTDTGSYSVFDALATRENSTGNILLKVVNASSSTLTNTPISISSIGWQNANATVTTLTSPSVLDENTIANPTNVSPTQTQLSGLSLPSFNYTLQPYSVTVFRLSPGITYTITATAETGGTITPGGTVVVPGGGSQTFTVAANTGYAISDVKVDGTSQGAIASYTFTNLQANHTISATFVAVPTSTITASAGTNGTISPSGAVLVNQGSSQIFTITPNTGYAISQVSVDGVNQGAVSSYTFSNIQTNHTISASFVAIPTFTIAASSGPNGTISPSGAVIVNQGANGTFTMTPNTGYAVDTVTVDGVSQGAITSYTFNNVQANHNISATFRLDANPFLAYYTFDETTGTTPADSSGSAFDATLINGPTWVAGKYGNAVNLDGANDYVSLPTGFLSSLNDFTISTWVKLDQNRTWNRIFDFGSGTSTFMFLCPSALGGIRYSIRYNNSSEQQINAATTFVTGSWQHVAVTMEGSTVTLYLNGVQIGQNTNMTIKPSMLGNTTQNWIGRSQYNDYYLDGQIDDFRIYKRALSATEIAALLAGPTYTITASVGIGGTITPSGVVQVNHGANQSFVIAAQTGFTLSQVTVDGLNQGAVNTYTFNNVTANHTITATFVPTYTITASVVGSDGSISPAGVVSVNSGASQVFTITPSAGYGIVDMKVDNASITPMTNYTFGNVTANHTISAAFAKPVGMNNKSARTDSKVPGRVIKVWGKVKTTNLPTSFVISDGYGTPITVMCNGAALPTGFDSTKTAVVTGVMSADKNVAAQTVQIF